MANGSVPTALLTPLIERWTREIAPTTDGSCDEEAARSILVQKTGLSRDMIYKVAEGKRVQVSFTTADSILSAMGYFRLWYCDPELRPYYYEGEEPPPDLSKPVKCARDGCSNWFEFDPTVKRRKYCSNSCNTYAAAIRTGRKRKGRRTRWGNRWGSGVVGFTKSGSPRREGVSDERSTFGCGHPRSEENSQPVWHNNRQRYYDRCATCHRERMRKARRENGSG